MENRKENEMETREYRGIRGYVIVYWGYSGIMGKKMETTIMVVIKGFEFRVQS